jgi:hypothetical protein
MAPPTQFLHREIRSTAGDVRDSLRSLPTALAPAPPHISRRNVRQSGEVQSVDAASWLIGSGSDIDRRRGKPDSPRALAMSTSVPYDLCPAHHSLVEKWATVYAFSTGSRMNRY